MGGDNGLFARQEWVLNRGKMEKVGTIWTGSLAEQKQAFHDERTFEEDCRKKEDWEGTFGAGQLAGSHQAVIHPVIEHEQDHLSYEAYG